MLRHESGYTSRESTPNMVNLTVALAQSTLLKGVIK